MLDSLITEEYIKMKYPAVDKKSLLQEMSFFLEEKQVIDSTDVFFAEVWKREMIMSTGIGREVAIPHCCNETVREFVISVWQLSEPLDFDSIDEKPVSLVFLIAVPVQEQHRYMNVLSAISNFIRQPGNVDKMKNASEKTELLQNLTQIQIKD